MVRTMQIARTKIHDSLTTCPRRRQFSPAFKANLVEQCATASVAGVALEHSINPVTVHRWIRESRERALLARAAPPAFVALHLAAPALATPAATPTQPLTSAPPARDIQIEIKGSALSASIRWPLDGADACAAWLRALLQPAHP
jgi:transposase-like protein